MALLALAALIWIGCHIGIAGSQIRARLARVLGESGFRLAFSAASIFSITFLVMAYRRAPLMLLWTIPDVLQWLLVGIMLVAFILFAASVLTPNPTAIGGGAALDRAPQGIFRITRHPMLWSFALWAAVHVLANGDLAALLFFGAFLVTALAGMPSIDAKVAARAPGSWQRFAATTSIVPFQAITAGRNRFTASDVSWPAVGVGVALWIIALWAHPVILGVSALP